MAQANSIAETKGGVLQLITEDARGHVYVAVRSNQDKEAFGGNHSYPTVAVMLDDDGSVRIQLKKSDAPIRLLFV